jgi:hypothetical protein
VILLLPRAVELFVCCCSVAAVVVPGCNNAGVFVVLCCALLYPLLTRMMRGRDNLAACLTLSQLQECIGWVYTEPASSCS